MAGHKGEGRILYGEPEILYGGSYLAAAINFFINSPKYKLLILFITAVL